MGLHHVENVSPCKHVARSCDHLLEQCDFAVYRMQAFVYDAPAKLQAQLEYRYGVYSEKVLTCADKRN